MIVVAVRRTRLLSTAVIVLLAVAACTGDNSQPTTTTTSASPPPSPTGVMSGRVVGEEAAPAGSAHASTLSWGDAEVLLNEISPDLVSSLEDLGASDAAFSVFVGGVTGGPEGEEIVDLHADGHLEVSGAVTFPDGGRAGEAVELLIAEIAAFAEESGGELRALQIDDGSGVVVSGTAFTGETAALAWAEGSVALVVFAQGEDAEDRARALADAMRTGK